MSEDRNTTPVIPIPDDEEDLIATVEDYRGRELTDEEKNVAIAQAEIIGDL